LDASRGLRGRAARRLHDSSQIDAARRRRT